MTVPSRAIRGSLLLLCVFFSATLPWNLWHRSCAYAAGPKYILPQLDSGPAFSLIGKPAGFSEDSSATSVDVNGGGPGVCRYDSAFGKQIVSYQVRWCAWLFVLA